MTKKLPGEYIAGGFLREGALEKGGTRGPAERLKMVFGLGGQRERLYKPLYIAHLLVLAGVVYYYFQGSVGKPAPDSEIAEGPSQLVGETLRPVWGPMDKCYPVTTQRRRVKVGKKQAKAMAPKATGGRSAAAPKEETELRSQQEGEVRPPGVEAAGRGPAVKEKEAAEEEEAAGAPGWEENTKVQKEVAVYPSEASAVESKEERPGGWVPQLLRKLWLDWVPAADIPKTQNHE
ncbi:uncharacterized protein LOC114218372 [Eumetopias jubatus]|uniref:uncharacterized protein LOC114218372 n=1 Tax=Eumetopias jubatus TaxID=34886 RepID=UPI0010164151|nr:uncharacterized protein LOC114218372 [Eumetopias jubatus]